MVGGPINHQPNAVFVKKVGLAPILYYIVLLYSININLININLTNINLSNIN